MNFRASPLAIAITAAISATPAIAETTERDSATLLNQVTVTATRTEQQLKDVASSVTVIDSEQIENRHVKDISDLVRYEPGVSVSGDTRTGPGDFTIRGMSGNRVKIITDGVSQANNFQLSLTRYINAARNFVDTDSLKAAEIVKGPASSLYGSDAIGGLVAFQTKDPADILKRDGDLTAGFAKASYSSVDKGFTETVSVANRSGQLESMVLYTRRDSQETETYITNQGDVFGATKRGEANPADNRVNNLLTKVQYQLNDNHRLGFTGEYHDTLSEVKVRDASVDGTTSDDTKERSRIGFEHDWDNAGLAAFDRLHWQLDWQKTTTGMKTLVPAYVADYGSFQRPYPEREQDYNYEEKGFQLHAQFNKELGAHGLTYGIHATDDKVSNKSVETNLEDGSIKNKDYIPEVSRNVYGVFIQDEFQVTDKLTVTPGVRYDKYSYKPSQRVDGMNFEDSSDSAVTGRLGSVYKLDNQYSVFAQFSQGFRAPDLIDMFYTLDNVTYLIQGNPDLKPEKSNSFEAGLRGGTLYGDFEITAFYNRYKDFIDTVAIQDPKYPWGVTRAENLQKAWIKGVELKGQVFLDELADQLDGFTLNGSVAYAKGEGEVDNKKNPLNSVAPLTAVMGLAFEAPAGNWGSELLWTVVKGKDESDLSSSTSFEAPGYGVVDLTAHYKPTDEITLRAGLFNLTDKKYWAWESVSNVAPGSNNMDRFTKPGRHFNLSAKYEF
ncbi:TonB-dependent hemoglobin/transferrin/lactoferrin family receptor [Parendozoicomonas haliclonae]|uniref:Hemin receptor n=1 Tax=Parendozoicomonas haliclonae TaxID=1960125 RepID=A0A1X7AIY5_9GAMM|nr:TonB-dependent hemoglobin/transferrin/lactoferrin family receptor [Parendozoicomonas haliclonae]SMA44917.1 Hemin receptor precursor [Parendozoicomonas haliclonae]